MRFPEFNISQIVLRGVETGPLVCQNLMTLSSRLDAVWRLREQFPGRRQDKKVAYRLSNEWIKNTVRWIKGNRSISRAGELGAAFVVGRERTANVRVPVFIHFHVISYATQWNNTKYRFCHFLQIALLVTKERACGAGQKTNHTNTINRPHGGLALFLPRRTCPFHTVHTTFGGENETSEAVEGTMWRRRRRQKLDAAHRERRRKQTKRNDHTWNPDRGVQLKVSYGVAGVDPFVCSWSLFHKAHLDLYLGAKWRGSYSGGEGFKVRITFWCGTNIIYCLWICWRNERACLPLQMLICFLRTALKDHFMSSNHLSKDSEEHCKENFCWNWLIWSCYE